MCADESQIKICDAVVKDGEFEEYLTLLRTPGFRSKVLDGPPWAAVKLRDLTWHGPPNKLLTFMIQRAVLGVESCIPNAVEYELARRYLLTAEMRCALENPFMLGGGTARAMYDKLPALADPSAALSRHDATLYERIRLFYKCVRNPIFHGNEIACLDENYDAVVAAFEMFARVYKWIDSWYTAFGWGWSFRLKTVGNR